MIDVLVITDGRPHLHPTIRSAREHLQGDIGHWWIYTDHIEADYPATLQERYEFATVIHHPLGRQGFGGAIRFAWEHLWICSSASHIFHLEDDFTFNRPVPLDDMASLLDRFPYLAQLALRRQPWNAAEIVAGGVIETNPEAFVDRRLVLDDAWVQEWLEHRQFWTTNPSLFPRWVLQARWPKGPRSEGLFTHQMLGDPDLRFGYYGARDSGEWVHHIGDHRVGTGY